MELSIFIDSSNPDVEVNELKKFIDVHSIPGVSEAEIEGRPHVPGTQGFDILNSLKLVVEAAEKPLVELVICLQKYVDGYRSKVTIKNSKGATLRVDMGRGLDKDTIDKIVKSFLEESSN